MAAMPSADVERRILALGSVAPKEPRLGTRIARGLAVGLAVTALAVGVHPRPDLARLPTVPFAISTTLLLVVTVLAMVLGLRSRASTGPSVSRLVLIVVATTPMFLAVTLLLPLGQAPPFSPWASVMGALGCLATMLVIGAVSLAGLVSALRHAVPVAPRLRGAALGAAAGALGGIAMHLRCPAIDPVHIATGHVGPILLVAALGALLGPRFLRP